MPMRRLLKLLVSNGSGRRPKIITGFDPDWDGDDDSDPAFDPDHDGDEASIYFYDVIGGWDQPTTEEIVRGIRALGAKTIHLRINSPGGLVFEATAIKTALEQHPAHVIAHVDGMAASAASTLMLAGDEIEIAPGAFVMIHNPSSLAWGDADEMRRCAEMLDAIRDSIASQYAARTGLSVEELTAMMKAETWLSAEQAVEKKFVDRIAARAPQAANLRRFDLSAYDHPPKALLAPPQPDPVAAYLKTSQERHARMLRLFERAA
ncbi:ATP-dependent+Clp+protease+proteolytic+subunit [Methylocapsa aurea]|uniref:head maturation protease, ClpP-related n=1 Tax=Methylocapsa aurea TaxID=663610 RepID=UPI003D187804